MLTIYSSSSIFSLFDKLQHDLLNLFYSSANLLSDNCNVLVQSAVMGKWLQIHLAQRHGVVANINFPLPAAFIWQLYNQLLDIQLLEQHSSYSKAAMSWQLMKIIDENFSDLPTILKDFIASNDRTEQQLLAFQLCQNIADVFDQYLVYRPDWIRQWQTTKITDQTDPQHWQAQLWQQLIECDKQQMKGAHRVQFHDLALDYLKNDKVSATQVFNKTGLKTLFVFCVSSLPAQHLELLCTLAQHIDVYFYLQNPSQHYFGDIQSRKKQAWIQTHSLQNSPAQDLHFCEGNPLLAAMGIPIKEFTDQLLALAPNAFQEPDAFEEVNVMQPQLLAHAQFEIRQLLFSGNSDSWLATTVRPNFSLKANDNSIRIHSCHSRLRELQVLHHQLLDFFAEDASLEPRDILILAPNPADYAPYIKAVFGHDGQQPGFLPCAISDASILSESPLINSFFTLLDIGKQRFKVSLIKQLINQPAIYNQWKFNIEEREQIFRWIQNLGVHWAWNSAEKSRWSLPESTKYTWENAIHRSLLGLILDESAGVFTGTQQPQLAYNAQNREQALLWGRWFNFLHTVQDIQQALTQQRSVHDWVNFLSKIIQDFFNAQNAQDMSALLALQHTLSDILRDAQINAFNQVIDLQIIRTLLQQELSKPQQSFQLIAGKINFTSLLPLCGVPFRIICIVGMNDGEYPKSNSQIEFNLINQSLRRLGDRSRREEDAYQFLQAVIAAQDKLHISFIGRNIQDNSPKNPSTLVQELLNYCTQTSYLAYETAQEQNVQQHLFIEHPLFAFNACYFKNDQKFINYSPVDFLCANIDAQENFNWHNTNFNSLNIAHDKYKVNLDELLYFYKKTAKYFCNKQHIYLNEDFYNLDDEEPLNLDDYLINYQYFYHALQAQQQGASFVEWQTDIKYHSNTPDARNADLASHKIWQLASQAHQLFNTESISATPASYQTKHCYFSTNNFEFNTQLQISTKNNFHSYKHNAIKPQDQIGFWLTHLAANISSSGTTSYLAHKVSGTFKLLVAPALEQEYAQAQLSTFIHYYLIAECSPQRQFFPFDSKLSYTYAESLYKGDHKINALEKTLEELTSTNDYVQLIFNSIKLEHNDFQNIAEQLLTPMLMQLYPHKTEAPTTKKPKAVIKKISSEENKL